VKILLANKFFFLKGGSERVFFNEAELLESRGNSVVFFSMKDPRNRPSPWNRYFVESVSYTRKTGPVEMISSAAKIIYSFEARRNIGELIDREKPDLAHLHNIHHQLSPSIITALKKRGIPVVMTLHDYKMVCPAYTFFRNGEICEKCAGGKYYRSFINRCTKDSYLKSLINVIEMYFHHRILNLSEIVDVFIAPSRFLMNKLISMGFQGKIVQQPYLMDTRGYQPVYGSRGRSLCYFGRLSREKGIMTLIRAMAGVDGKLTIIGTGPEEACLRRTVEKMAAENIRFLGYLSGQPLREEIRRCRAVVVPSRWYENYPCSILEAFALGKLVIGAGIGGIPEMIEENKAGLIFEPENVDDLRAKIKIILNNHQTAVTMGRRARKFIEQELNPAKHYRALSAIYRKAREG